MLERSYTGESARAAAFADSMSPFLGMESSNGICAPYRPSPVGAARQFRSGNRGSIHKPEPSPILDAALRTDAQRSSLLTARFPKATVQRETDGYSVEFAI